VQINSKSQFNPIKQIRPHKHIVIFSHLSWFLYLALFGWQAEVQILPALKQLQGFELHAILQFQVTSTLPWPPTKDSFLDALHSEITFIVAHPRYASCKPNNSTLTHDMSKLMIWIPLQYEYHCFSRPVFTTTRAHILLISILIITPVRFCGHQPLPYWHWQEAQEPPCL
jgi:hypothetical protein